MTFYNIEFDFWPYIIFDKKGNDIGIRDDAPEEAKKAYKLFHTVEYDERGHVIR